MEIIFLTIGLFGIVAAIYAAVLKDASEYNKAKLHIDWGDGTTDNVSAYPEERYEHRPLRNATIGDALYLIFVVVGLVVTIWCFVVGAKLIIVDRTQEFVNKTYGTSYTFNEVFYCRDFIIQDIQKNITKEK